jgi:hypothetical protein
MVPLREIGLKEIEEKIAEETVSSGSIGGHEIEVD